MKAFIALGLLLGTSNAMAEKITIYSTSTYKIISEAPYVDGGTLKFDDIEVEVDGKLLPLTISRVFLANAQEICNQSEFKNIYIVDEHAGFFKKSVKLTEQGIEKARHSTVVIRLDCMKEAY